jgi:hypothetical protein
MAIFDTDCVELTVQLEPLPAVIIQVPTMPVPVSTCPTLTDPVGDPEIVKDVPDIDPVNVEVTTKVLSIVCNPVTCDAG